MWFCEEFLDINVNGIACRPTKRLTDRKMDGWTDRLSTHLLLFLLFTKLEDLGELIQALKDYIFIYAYISYIHKETPITPNLNINTKYFI